MKIFIAGGTGRVATALSDFLVAAGHQVIAGARHPENVTNTEVTAVKLDLTASVAEIAQVVGKVDVIYFTAGSRGKDLLQTDAFGAVKLMRAAELNQISRFIMLSSLHALQPDKWSQGDLAGLTNYNIAKFFADNYLITNTNLSYTILQPATLTETPATHKIAVNHDLATANSLVDVAQTLAEILKFPNTIGKVIEMSAGPTPIAKALAEI